MERSEAWFVAITAAVIGFIAGMAWSDLDHQAKWLYDYQTLVTGTLAVAAAFITVNAMNKTEERQQKRHEELMKLSLRPDKMAVDRAAYLQAIFQQLGDETDEFSGRVAHKYAAIGAGTPVDEDLDAAIAILGKFLEALEMPAITDAAKFFSPRMNGIFAFLNAKKRYLRDCYEKLKQVRGVENKEANRSKITLMRRTGTEFGEMSRHLTEFANQLVSLSEEYA
ncbi:hypothetical protein EOB36_05895 [Mesorhizobium sp. M6A.T.Cr.TU.017.01.1.1]|uniref:hypothetical protein n=1 Tax=Mesorhizobium sp. M6A.T.Cr.TU.017.01.1.1 TaxID=2496774 RepID=UPI000FD36747|nr:hypothetical protein [Mesorhizobium sp. M6A.T.Cr.TU.017.01.1.1]RUV03491.1 hypothetical protein EOB36_05895 [Mesorhizobium sp. M6A.T.Cr.TU.017.01.1.1]